MSMSPLGKPGSGWIPKNTIWYISTFFPANLLLSFERQYSSGTKQLTTKMSKLTGKTCKMLTVNKDTYIRKMRYKPNQLVSWCLTSLFSANIWLYQRQKVRGGELSLPSIGRAVIY